MKFKLDKENSNKFKRMVSNVFFDSSLIVYLLFYIVIFVMFRQDIKNIYVNKKYAYLVTKDKYSKLSKEDKNLYVANAFLNVVNDCCEFDSNDKKDLVEVSYFLQDYGYLYDIDDLVNLESRLCLVEVDKREKEKDSNVRGLYYPIDNEIVTYDEDSLSHEVTHLITGASSYNYNKFILESITSSIDVHYYNCSSYDWIMRNQVLFLSEIVGRDNLIKSYISGDINYLEDLICRYSTKEQCDKLLNLFNEEYDILYSNEDEFDVHRFIDVNYESSIMLKNIWEKKMEKKINEDAICFAIYNSCLYNSDYKIGSDLFYGDVFSISIDNYDSFVFNVDDRDMVINSVDDYYNLDFNFKVNKSR